MRINLLERRPNCSSNSRLLLHESIADETLDRIDEAMHEWVLGDPLDPETRMGAIIEPSHMEKILSNIEKAKDEGATVRCGGNQTRTESGGWFVEPTIFTDVTPDMTVARDEVFGPVLSVSTFTHADEGIAMANDTDYGLHASVFTSNVKRAS